MLPPGALENADNPDLATGQKIITTSCSFILNKLNFVGRGVQRTQNFQDLAHGLVSMALGAASLTGAIAGGIISTLTK